MWVAQVRLEVARLATVETEVDGLPALRRGLARFERVQVMEKCKFWRLVDGLSRGPLRERLVQLWT